MTLLEAIKRDLEVTPAVGTVLTGGVWAGEAGVTRNPPYAVMAGGTGGHVKFSAGELVDMPVTITAVAKDANTAMLGMNRIRDHYDADPDLEISDSEKKREIKVMSESSAPETRRTAVGIDFTANVTIMFKLWRERLD